MAKASHNARRASTAGGRQIVTSKRDPAPAALIFPLLVGPERVLALGLKEAGSAPIRVELRRRVRERNRTFHDGLIEFRSDAVRDKLTHDLGRGILGLASPRFGTTVIRT